VSSKLEILALMDVVGRINEQILHYVGDSDLWLDATVSSDGYVNIVEFLGCTVYNSGDSNLLVNDNDEEESIETYIVREVNRVLQSLTGLKIWVYQ
jgi:hypothetical protein